MLRAALPSAHHEMAAVAKTLKNVFLAEPFMVGGNAGRHACAHGRAVHIRKMALQRFSGHGERVVTRFEQVGEARHNIGTDTFRQADGVRDGEARGRMISGLKRLQARFEIGGKRDMGRNTKIELVVGRFPLPSGSLRCLPDRKQRLPRGGRS